MGCKHFREFREGDGFCSHVVGMEKCEEKKCCINCSTEYCNMRCAHSGKPKNTYGGGRVANKKKLNPESEAALEVVAMEKRQEAFKKTEQELKEIAIAQVFEMAGKVKAAAFFEAQTRLMKLVSLKQVKDAKTYREKFGMTWEQFCEHVGEDRRRIDEELMDLKPFKADFLAKFANGFGIEINKIKYLGEAISADSAKIQDNAIVYDGEVIPLTPEHKDDIQALLERLEEASKSVEDELKAQKKAFERVQNETHKEITKLQKTVDKLEGKAAKKGLTAEEDAFLQHMENLRIAFDGYLLQIDPERMEDLNAEAVTPRMRAAYLSNMDYFRKQILAYTDTAITMHGDPTMCPESGWQQPE